MRIVGRCPSCPHIFRREGLVTDSIKRAEAADGEPRAQLGTLSAIRRVFELAGLDFEGGGVRRATDRNTRMIAAIAAEVESLVRSGLNLQVKRDAEFFDRGVQHVTDKLSSNLERPLLERMVRRVMPKERG
jgi:hypothetical protein